MIFFARHAIFGTQFRRTSEKCTHFVLTLDTPELTSNVISKLHRPSGPCSGLEKYTCGKPGKKNGAKISVPQNVRLKLSMY